MSDKVASRNQLARMLHLMRELRGRAYPNASELAARCEVSRRTIYRDFDALLAAGIPVEYRPDRRGYELAHAAPLPPLPLDDVEALALIAHTLRPVPEGEPSLALAARRGLLKILQGLPQASRERAEGLMAAIEFRPPGSSSGPLASLLAALASGGPLLLRLRGGREGTAVIVHGARLVGSGDRWALAGRLPGERRRGRWPLCDIASVEAPPREEAASRRERTVDSGDSAIRIKTVLDERAHSSVG